MTPILFFILGKIAITQPMATMDACITALHALDPVAAFNSYCIDPRSGENVPGRKQVKAKPVPPLAAKPAATPASLPEWDV